MMGNDPEVSATGSGGGIEYDNMLAAWEDVVGRSEGAPFIHVFDETLTFGQVDQLSDAFAVALADNDVGIGDRVAIYLQNDPQWVVALLGIWKLRGIAVPLNPMLKQKEVNYLLRDSGAKALICQDGLYASAVAPALEGTAVNLVISTHPADLLDGTPPALAAFVPEPKSVPDGTADLMALLRETSGPPLPRLNLQPDDVALLTYTSGTTGPPKGAMNTHRNLVHNSQVYRDWFHLTSDDVILGVAPLSHITGITGHIGAAILSGAAIVLMHRFQTEEAIRLLERWGATFTVGSITVFIALMESDAMDTADLSSLTKVASGGAPVSPAVAQRFESRTGAYIHNVYGMTETTGPALFVPFGVHSPVGESGALSVGVPVTGSEVGVVDPTSRAPVDVGEVGEIVVTGPMVVKGYWNGPEETEHAMPGGRMHTGDVGCVDEDGWFYIVDRAKDQINAGGFKIWPREVEDVLYEHPAVREAVVVGAPDPYRGETVAAFVSLTAGSQATGEEFIEFCRERMAAYKYPRSVDILLELPKTASGKLLRREMRARAVRAADEAPVDSGN